MKKLTALAAALVLLTATGCGSAPQNEPPVSEPVQTEAVAETTAPAPETTAEVTETTAEAAKESPADTKPAEPDPAAADTRTYKLLKKIETWDKGHVNISFRVDADGAETSVTILQMGKKMQLKMKLLSFEMEMRGNEDGLWVIDNPTMTYAPTKSGGDADQLAPDNALTQAEYGKYLGTGEAEFKGVTRVYEDFRVENDGEEETLRLFFDDDDNMLGVKIDSVEESDYSMDYTITFTEDKDETPFQIPADYKEITEDEMSEKMMMNMFAMMGELMGAAESDE